MPIVPRTHAWLVTADTSERIQSEGTLFYGASNPSGAVARPVRFGFFRAQFMARREGAVTPFARLLTCCYLLASNPQPAASLATACGKSLQKE